MRPREAILEDAFPRGEACSELLRSQLTDLYGQLEKLLDPANKMVEVEVLAEYQEKARAIVDYWVSDWAQANEVAQLAALSMSSSEDEEEKPAG